MYFSFEKSFNRIRSLGLLYLLIFSLELFVQGLHLHLIILHFFISFYIFISQKRSEISQIRIFIQKNQTKSPFPQENPQARQLPSQKNHKSSIWQKFQKLQF